MGVTPGDDSGSGARVGRMGSGDGVIVVVMMKQCWQW